MFRKALKCLSVSVAVLALNALPVQASVTQLCGEGRLVDLYSGGWNNGEIYLKIDESVSSAPNYFSAGLKVMRINPSIDDGHKNRIYSTLLLAVAKDQVVELRSHTQTAGGIADCKFISQVLIRAQS